MKLYDMEIWNSTEAYLIVGDENIGWKYTKNSIL